MAPNVFVNARRRLSDVPVRAKAGFAAAVRFACYFFVLGLLYLFTALAVFLLFFNT
jgi:hypothetical protein